MQVTLGLLTYNHEKFVVQALRSVLNQEHSPLQILITDDASSDRTPQLIREHLDLYEGPHQVQFYANEVNRGLSANINRHMELAAGELYVIAAGDDVSYPSRVKQLVKAFLAAGPDTMSLHSNARKIDENGNDLGVFFAQDPLSQECRNPEDAYSFHGSWVLGAAHAWNRRVFGLFGPLPAGVDHEDWVIPFRSGLIGRIVYVNEVLVDYRVHGLNMSFVDMHSGSRKWYADQIRHLDQHIAALGCMHKDLNLIEQVLPERAAVAVSLKEINQRALTKATDSRELLQPDASFRRKVQIARKYWRDGKRLRERLVWLLTYFCPSVYLSYIGFRGMLARTRRASV